MNAIINDLKHASTTIQAFGVSIGGLIGVFATLMVFFIFIWVSVRVGKKE